jgi:hypothetical protein
MGKGRERQIILKTDKRTIFLEMGLGRKFLAKSSGCDENRTFLEGDVPEVAVKNGRWVDPRFRPDRGRRRRRPSTTFRPSSSLVTLYRASPDYQKLAPATKENWGPWLDRIAAYFDLSIAAFERPEKIRPIIRKWLNRYADRPRTADYGLQVLSRVCAHAVDPLGMIAGNPCEGIKQLYKSNRAEIIWTDADVVRIKKTCSVEIGWAVDLASHTGPRRRPASAAHVPEPTIMLTGSPEFFPEPSARSCALCC